MYNDNAAIHVSVEPLSQHAWDAVTGT
jgi:hypothetical protein